MIGGDTEYYVAKYICHKKFHILDFYERKYKKRNLGKWVNYGNGEITYFKNIEEEIVFYMENANEGDNLVKRVRKIQKEQHIGENHGR